MSRSKSNSDFGELILWGFVGYGLYKLFGKNEPIVGQANVVKPLEYVHTRIPMVFGGIQPYIDKNGILRKKAGITIPAIFFEDNVVQNRVGTYSVKLTKIKLNTQIILNSDLHWNDISEFSNFYKKERRYDLNEINLGFNTVEGVIFHEKQHQDDYDDLIINKGHGKRIETVLANLNAKTKEEASLRAKRQKDGFVNAINNEMKLREVYAREKEWYHYHDLYVEYKNNKKVWQK
jgi:hypothetical protein